MFAIWLFDQLSGNRYPDNSFLFVTRIYPITRHGARQSRLRSEWLLQ